MRVRAQQGDTVDLLCWRHLGRTDLAQLTLEMNPGLADYGPILPHGLVIDLPESPQDKPNAPLLQLWD